MLKRPSKEPPKRKPVGSNASSPSISQFHHHDTDGRISPRDLSRQSFLLNDTDPPLLNPRNLDYYPKGTSPRSPHPTHDHNPFETGQRPRLQPLSRTTESISNEPVTSQKRNLLAQAPQRSMSLRPFTKEPYPEQGQHGLAQDNLVNATMITKTPRPPVLNKLTSFFGWKTATTLNNQARAPSPTYPSDLKSNSPVPSPLSRSPQSINSSIRSVPNAIDTTKANAALAGALYGNKFPSMSVMDVDPIAAIDDLQEELREISGELAGSIRREMELEDIVERLQFETNQAPEVGRRTSDYFSDSGSGSARYTSSEHGYPKGEDLAKQKRQSEQDKAQFKLSLSQKIQDERGRRKVLEAHIQQLGDQMQVIDEERAQFSGAGHRVRDLETSLDDHRRRLQEEKLAKQNFEDMLGALKDELNKYKDERDNLRDEIVPQLKARVDGLEVEASDFQKLTYENTRMQQELQLLKQENNTSSNARRAQGIDSIAEEAREVGLQRSNSSARSGLNREGSLKRSNSTASKEREISERVKDIELQRDSLHKALKLLLDRQNYQIKEHVKAIKLLTGERDRALENQSPRRQGYEKEVKGLKHEVQALRSRADDAIQQKYMCEKGLGGLKKDLDRAEEETQSLRKLLQEHDISIPERSPSPRARDRDDAAGTSASLEKAYRELQRSQAMSLTKLRELHGTMDATAVDADTEAMMQKLLRSMSDVEGERDLAKQQAARFRAEAESFKDIQEFHTGEKAGLSDQLRSAAARMETLSQQVEVQLGANRSLRARLAEAVSRGEQEQKDSTTRIQSMQDRLKTLEDRLMAAQMESEARMAQHEEEVRTMTDSHNTQLQRLKANMKVHTGSARTSARTSTISPMITGKSPRLDKTTSGIGRSLDEALRVEFLEKRVADLEDALGDADKEMEEVISRMNLSQIEVIELQSARDEAMRQTRKLQAELIREREQVDRLAKK